MRKIQLLGLAGAVWASSALAVDLQLTARSGGSSSISASPGTLVSYEIVGLLADATNNEGIALAGFDLVLTGNCAGSECNLPQANNWTSGDMANFSIDGVGNEGLVNPAGFGGTQIGGKLIQVGGAQNTINNGIGADPVAPYPTGSVITGLGWTEIVLATGSFTAPPSNPGIYHLEIQNAFANVIKNNETGADFWATEAATVPAPTNLEIDTNACAQAIDASTAPPSCGIDARQTFEPDGSSPDGWDFLQIVMHCDATGITAGEFSINSTAGTPPNISNANGVGVNVALDFDTFIPAGAWTCVTHTASTSQKCLGYLPGDADGNHVAENPADVNALVGFLNTGVPALAAFQCDSDRSGGCGASDVTRLADVLNGADSFAVWAGVNIGACPSP